LWSHSEVWRVNTVTVKVEGVTGTTPSLVDFSNFSAKFCNCLHVIEYK
jgi:hypothetical protein